MALVNLPSGGDKRALVRDMFDRIAPRYDVMNRLMSMGLDQRWRRTTLASVSVGPGDRVLDLACGTGDLAEQAAALGAGVVGVDFAGVMLRHARHREVPAEFVQGDAAALPFRDASKSVVTCGFALRNFVSLPGVFAELARVLEPGGRIALIDVDRPSTRLVRAAHSLYFDRVVPMIGGLLSDRAAYRYLPESTAYLPPSGELLEMLEKAGFERVARRGLMFGAAQILTGVRAARPGEEEGRR
jgi:demethylmenaquinone methyltransferase/2-methoxy-6-polyprenyl-1,4-benzoquinol methylase